MAYKEIDESSITLIDSVSSFIEMIRQVKETKEAQDGTSTELYFRGQETEFWDIEPSIFRDDMLSIEHKLMQIPLQKSPTEFRDLNSMFDIMTKYQHYGMCTRLLDLTTNPLVALYFACKKHGAVKYVTEDGEVEKEPYGVIYYTDKYYSSQSTDIEIQIVSALASYDLEKENTLSDVLERLSKDDLSKLNAVDYSSEIGGGLAIERVAVVQQGNWIGPELSGIDEEVANKMGILPIPLKGVKEDCIPTGISIYWCINSQSGDKEKEASKEFLKWLFQSDEGKQIVVNDFGFVPAFNNYDDVEITDPLSKEVKRYIDEGKTLPWVMGGFPSGYEPKAAADFQGYFSGEYTFDQMVDQLKADFVELKK